MTDPGRDGPGDAGARPAAHPAWGRLVLSLGILGLGVFYAAEAAAIRVLPTYAKVGPRFFPYAVAAALIIVGALLAWRAWRGLDSDADRIGDAPASRLSMGVVLGGLILQSVTIQWIGFVPAATITFVLTAAGFGSRRYLLDALIGLALATGSFVGFTRGLGLSLPAGPLEGLL